MLGNQARPWPELQEQENYKGSDNIGSRPGQGYQDQALAAVAEVYGIDGHRLCPAKAKDPYHQQAQGIEMGQGIQG